MWTPPLVHAGLNADLTNAFTAGRSVAGQILGDFSRSGGRRLAEDRGVLSGLSCARRQPDATTCRAWWRGRDQLGDLDSSTTRR
jgi:hypothetical protein